MAHPKIFWLVSLLVVCLSGCFSAEKREAQQAAHDYPIAEPVPVAQTPDEAIQQLQESNSRLVHGERRWAHAAAQLNGIKPFVLLVNASTKPTVPGEIFDLPPGAARLLTWSPKRTHGQALDAGVSAGVKVVLVLLPYRQGLALSATSAATSLDVGPNENLRAVCRQLQAQSSALSSAVAHGHAKFLGATLHPATKRLLCFSLAP